jgi:flavodoxin
MKRFPYSRKRIETCRHAYVYGIKWYKKIKGVLYMKIGIIVYSNTGNTLGVANRMKEKLLAEGHAVTLERVIAANSNPSPTEQIKLTSIPDVSPYDVVIFGSPVQGLSLAPVMKTYMSQLPPLKGRKAGFFVTQQFPFPWMGGNHAIRQAQQICKGKGADLYAAGDVNWSSKKREDLIRSVITNTVSYVGK